MAGVGRGFKRVLIEGLGWILVVLGLAALALPGPGMLMLFGGLALLSTQYDWAEKRLAPVRVRALQTAADSVSSTPRIVMSLIGIACLVSLGIFWGVKPPAPGWWPLRDNWWLIGGWSAGATILASAVIAFGTMIYSFKYYRGEEGAHRLAKAQRRMADGDEVDGAGEYRAQPAEERAS